MEGMNLSFLSTMPVMILACIGIVAAFVKIGRKDKTLEDHTVLLRQHGKLLKICSENDFLTKEHCKDEQDRCMEKQDAHNEDITKSIDELKREVKEDRALAHAELMKITKSMGRIEGIISRLRFNSEGELI